MANKKINNFLKYLQNIIKFSETFTATDGTSLNGFNNWITTVWDFYLFAGTIYQNIIDSNTLIVGSAYDRVEAKRFIATSHNPKTKIIKPTITLVDGSCTISRYSTSTSPISGGDCYIGFHIGLKTTEENSGFKVLIKFNIFGTWIVIYKEGTLVYSAEVSIGNTDLNFWNFDIKVSNSSAKIWLYQGTKPTNPTHTYDGSLFSGINFRNTYCGEYSKLQKITSNYETILGRFDNYNIQVIS